MSDSTHTLENPLPAIDEMSLEEDPPAEEIGLALERFRDGSVGNRTVVTSAHSMEEGREAAELFQKWLEEFAPLVGVGPNDTIDSARLATLYYLMRLIIFYYLMHGGTYPVSLEPPRLGNIDIPDDDLNEAFHTIVQTSGCSPLAARQICQQLFRRGEGGETPFLLVGRGQAPQLAPVSEPDVGNEDSIEALLSPVNMGLDAYHDKAWVWEKKKRFANLLMTRRYYQLNEGDQVVVEGENGVPTPTAAWSMHYAAMATNLIFDIHGERGVKHLGRFLSEMLGDGRDSAGFHPALVAAAGARQFHHIPSFRSFQQAKAINPRPGGDKMSMTIEVVLGAFAAASMYDDQEHIANALGSRRDRTIYDAIALYLPPQYVNQNPRAVAKAFLALLNAEDLKDFEKDMNTCRSYNQIRAVAPYLMFMMDARADKMIRDLGPNRIRSLFGVFNDRYKIFGEICNRLEPFTVEVNRFMAQDMITDTWTARPLILPNGVTKNVLTSVAKVEGVPNDVSTILDKIVGQILDN